MNWRKYIEPFTVGIAVVIVCLIILIYAIFSMRKVTDTGNIKREIELMDSVIKEKQQHINSLERERDQHRQTLKELVFKNAILQGQYEANKVKHQENKKDYEKIPNSVNSLTRDELRREYANY